MKPKNRTRFERDGEHGIPAADRPAAVVRRFRACSAIWKRIALILAAAIRTGLAVATLVGLMLLPAVAYATATVTSATLNGATSVTVYPSASITAVVNVTNTGTGTAARWRSTGWRIATSPGTFTCQTHPNHDGAGSYSETFTITAPVTPGTYNAYFVAYNSSNCGTGAGPTYTLTNGVIVGNPVPTTTSIAPNTKNVGDALFTMTVNGTNFVSGSVVQFNGSSRTTSFVSATQLTATIPASDMLTAGTFNITVFNPAPLGGTSNAQTFTVNNPVPTTTSITPNTKNVGDALFTMTVNGTNFVTGSVVQFNGSSRTTAYVSGTQLTAQIPASDMLTAGTFNITVFNPTPGGGTSNAQTFTVNNAVPTITSISPTSKPLNSATFTLTVNGTNFVSTSTVLFQGSARTTTYLSATQLQATIPATDLTVLGTYAIDVFNPAPGGGTTATPQYFTVTPAAPTVATNAATGVTASAATLNGTVSSNGATTTVTFEYGLTTSYTETDTAIQSPLAANAVNAAVSVDEAGLNCNTLFHYRVKATNSAGTTYGPDQTFTTGACSAPFPATACAATRYNGDLGCSANDVSLTTITLAPSSISSCVSGTPVTLDLDLTVNFASPNRYDVGIFIANDGNLPTLLPANGGASSCSVDVLPITPPAYGYTFPDLDGVPQGTADTCGDGNSTINGGTGSGIKRMTGVTLPCYASAASGGKLFVPFVVTWDNQRSPVGNLCTSNLYPVPTTSSKCNAPASSVNINVVVKPVVTITNGGTTINPGANTTYTITVFNNSGGTLLDLVLTDPAVSLLTVTGASCAASGGASCPTTSVALLQGSGITIPSASLPNNSTLTFTVTATLSSAAVVGNHLINTATVTLPGGYSTSASDDDLIVISPSAAKSFSPSTITEGASSVLTVTLTNPTASPITSVAFTDTYPAGLVNTSSPGGASTCGGSVTADPGIDSVALSGGTIPASGSCTVTVNVTAATAGSYVNSTGAIPYAGGTISGASATLTVNVPVFGAFNACDTAAAPNSTCTSTTTATDSRITTKVAGTGFSLDIVALRTNGTRNTSYNNNVLIELLDASDNSGAVDSNNCRSSWTTVIASVNSSFTGANNGLITVGTFTVADAYRDVRVRVTNVGGSSRRGCSTDDFAIRPNSFAVSVTDSNWTTGGASRALSNTDASVPGSSTGTPAIHKAGQPFTVTATARNASNVTTSNYNVTVAPSPVLSACSPGTACTATFGTLNLGTPAFSAGAVTWSSASYDDVGAFDLTLQDTDFTSVDAADTPADCTSTGRYVCGAASVGRIVPDHFDLSGAAIVNRSDVNAGTGCSPASAFTYMGEPMKASFTLTAKNAGGNTTPKYEGVLNKFSNVVVNWTTDTGSDRVGLWMKGQSYVAGSGVCDVLFSNATPWVTSFVCTVGSVASFNRTAGPRVTIATSPASPSISWTAGVGTFAAHTVLERADIPDGAYGTINVGVAPVDADGVTVQSSALNLDADNSGTAERVSLGTTQERFGRLKIDSAYGSELLGIRVPIRAQYFSGTPGGTALFSDNSLDNCTAIGTSSLAFGNYKGALTSIGSTSLSAMTSGVAQLTVNPPATKVIGSVDLAINLGATAADANCIGAGMTATGANVPWLRGNWCGGTYVKDPNARLTFGSARSPFIFLRELY